MVSRHTHPDVGRDHHRLSRPLGKLAGVFGKNRLRRSAPPSVSFGRGNDLAAGRGLHAALLVRVALLYGTANSSPAAYQE